MADSASSSSDEKEVAEGDPFDLTESLSLRRPHKASVFTARCLALSIAIEDEDEDSDSLSISDIEIVEDDSDEPIMARPTLGPLPIGRKSSASRSRALTSTPLFSVLTTKTFLFDDETTTAMKQCMSVAMLDLDLGSASVEDSADIHSSIEHSATIHRSDCGGRRSCDCREPFDFSGKIAKLSVHESDGAIDGGDSDGSSVLELWKPALSVVQELIETEANYISGLETVLVDFYDEIEKQRILGADDSAKRTLKQIKSNLPSILGLSKMLVEALQHVYDCLLEEVVKMKPKKKMTISVTPAFGPTPIGEDTLKCATPPPPDSSTTATVDLDSGSSSAVTVERSASGSGSSLLCDHLDDGHGHNRTLSGRIIKRTRSRLTVEAPTTDSRPRSLGTCFLFYGTWLKLYSTYTNDYPLIVDMFGSDELRKNRLLQRFLKRRRDEGKHIVNLLILPIQRIPRYLLLLQQYRGKLPLGGGGGEVLELGLDAAIEMVDGVCQHVNEKQREIENISQLLYIQSQISGLTHSIVAPHRKFKFEFESKKLNKYTRRFFVFSDLVLIVNERWLVKQIIDVDTLKIAPRTTSSAHMTSMHSLSAASRSSVTSSLSPVETEHKKHKSFRKILAKKLLPTGISKSRTLSKEDLRHLSSTDFEALDLEFSFQVYAGSHCKPTWYSCETKAAYDLFEAAVMAAKREAATRKAGAVAGVKHFGAKGAAHVAMGETSLASDKAVLRHLQESWRLVDGMLKVTLHSASDLVAGDTVRVTSDAYCTVAVSNCTAHFVEKVSRKGLVSMKKEKKKKAVSKTVRRSLNPEWNATWFFSVKSALYDRLCIRVHHYTLLPSKLKLMRENNDKVLGELTLPVLTVLKSSTFGVLDRRVFALHNALKGSLTLSLKYYEEDSQLRPETIRAMALRAPGKAGVLYVTLHSAKGLPVADASGASDPYCVLSVRNLLEEGKRTAESKKSKTVMQCLDPEWQQTFDFAVDDPNNSELRIHVWDWDRFKADDALGVCSMRLFDLLQTEAMRKDKVTLDLNLDAAFAADETTKATVCVSCRFVFRPKML